MLQKITEYIIYSSKNGDKLSITFRSIVSAAIFIAGAFGFHSTTLDTNFTIDSVVNFITSLGTTISLAIACVGAVRKAVRSFMGINNSLN